MKLKISAPILSVETAVNVCSICISNEAGVLSLREEIGVNNHSSRISVLIEEVIQESRIDYASLSAVAVSGGPGSYTGLRIGISTAKGLCFALDIPLIAVDTLHAMAVIMKENIFLKEEEDYVFQPMIDARRMEVYTALFDKNLNVIKGVSADIITDDYFENIVNKSKIILGGNGALKCKKFADNNEHIIILDANVHTSVGISHIALKKLKNKEFADTVYYEPFYLKDFIPGKPKVKGLHE